MIPLLLLFSQLSQAASLPAEQGNPHTFVVPRVQAAAVIDGRLDEEVWSQAARRTSKTRTRVSC